MCASIVLLVTALLGGVDAHAHLSRVQTRLGTANNRDKIRNGIVRQAGSGIPGDLVGYGCDWCVLEGTNTNGRTDPSKWWTMNPAAHTGNPNTWPIYSCMTNDRYGDRGILDIPAGEDITTSAFLSADHGGFYRFELSYDTGSTNPSNQDFRNNPVSAYYSWWESQEFNGTYTYPGRLVGWGESELAEYISKTVCVGVSCTGNNIYEITVTDTWRFPSNVPSGPAVLRWIWSSIETNEVYSHCVDVNIVSSSNPPPPVSFVQHPQSGCSNWESITISTTAGQGSNCENLCRSNASCESFNVGRHGTQFSNFCSLMRSGCNRRYDFEWDLFVKA